ncbi:PfkB family carbohydrate kinase [Methanosarcina sp. T3]|uniref:PfkB family carbohydrate kinase n=1 Tax=Methanosarcina sp. T3 TaxID=3439062 RepID=UPI003F85E399
MQLTSQDGVYEEIKTTPVEVADTVGAGDAFSAGFLYAFLSGCGVSKAASVASMIGIFVRDCRTTVIRFLRCKFV